MRSYSFPISFKGLGLRPSTRVSRLDLALTKARNVLSEEWGLEGFSGPEIQPANNSNRIYFPTSIGKYLIYRNHVELIGNGDDLFPFGFSSNQKWHAAQLGNAYYATSGTHAIAIIDDLVYADTGFTYNTLTEHRGRILIGGIKSNWPSQFTDVLSDLPQLSDSTVLWSSPGAR